MQKATMTALLTAVLVGCTNQTAEPTQEQSTSASAEMFTRSTESAMRQLGGDQSANIIPAAKKAQILRLAEQVSETTGISLDKMYPIEQTPVITESEYGHAGHIKKGLFVWATTTNLEKREFDWTAMALVNLETFDVIDLKVNTSVGKTARDWSVGEGPFLLMNDYLLAASYSKNREAFVPSMTPRRVLREHGTSPLNDPDKAFMAEFTNTRMSRTYLVDHDFNVYEPKVEGITASSMALDLNRVGDLR